MRRIHPLPVLVVAVLTLLMLPGTAQAVNGGEEIAVNTTLAEDNRSPAIATAANGDFAVAWARTEPGPVPEIFYRSIYARLFNAAGAPLTGEIHVNLTPGSGLLGPIAPAVAPDAGGGFTVVWGNTYEKTSGIYARRFNAEGVPLSGEIPLDEVSSETEVDALPAITPDGTAGFTAAWVRTKWPPVYLGPSESDVYARRFNAAGEPLSGAMEVNTTTNDTQTSPAIASDGSGGFTVAWMSGYGYYPGTNFNVYARRFDAAGAPLSGEIAVNGPETYGAYPAIAPRPGGGFTVAWSGNGIRARRYDAAGSPVGNEIEVDNGPPLLLFGGGEPAIAAAPGGGFTVAWTNAESSTYSSPNNADLYERRFDSSGTALGGKHLLTTTTAGDQSEPALAPDGEGYFTAAWRSAPARYPASDGDILARRFQSGPETQIDSGPAEGSSTNDPTPSFSFSADEPGATFECELDGGGFSACTSPHETQALADGPHSFEVRATAAGKTDPIPASRHFRVDTVPPETSLDSAPPALTNDSSPSFAFSSEAGASFECALDGANFAACSSPYTAEPTLADGAHTFQVRAVDEAGNADQTPAGAGFTVDTTPPGLAITSGPSGPTRDTTPIFAFASQEAVSVSCALSKLEPVSESFSPCSSPFEAGPLSDASYLFTVLALDPAGNTAKAEVVFTVDTVAPDTAIKSGQADLTRDATPTFVLSSNEPESSFECELDGGGFSACSSPLTTGRLADGAHTLAARAVDAAGNVDASPASRSFRVDATPPQTSIDSGPSGVTSDNRPSFRFSADEAGAHFQCRLDGGGFSACSSPLTLLPLREGAHRFEVRASDAIGNTDPTPAVRGFSVDTRPPVATLSGRRQQPADGRIEFELSCSERCTVAASGRIVAWKGAGHKVRFRLEVVERRLGAGESNTLDIGLAQQTAWRKLRGLLGSGWRARAGINAVITDQAGNATIRDLDVWLRRR